MIITKTILNNGLNFIFKHRAVRREASCMMFVVNALASMGSFFAGLGSQACVVIWFDEPECPKNLIK